MLAVPETGEFSLGPYQMSRPLIREMSLVPTKVFVNECLAGYLCRRQTPLFSMNTNFFPHNFMMNFLMTFFQRWGWGSCELYVRSK